MTTRRTSAETLEAALVEVVSGIKEEIRVSLPATITAIYENGRIIDVQPSQLVRYAGRKDAGTLPVINRVVVVQPRTSTGEMRLPIHEGDRVTLMVADRCLDEWALSDGTPVEPAHLRYHDINDCFAFVGGWPTLANGFDAGSHDDAVFALGLAAVKIQPTGTITIGTDTAELLDIVDKLLNAMKNATVITAVGTYPLSPPTVALIVAAQSLLATIKRQA